jgi:A/G-specific adenine glycosylase
MNSDTQLDFAVDFAGRVVNWQQQHGRHDLPWQKNRDRYRVWVSEIMLQQTQVGTVIPYFERFMARFPRVADLAAASSDEVLAHWAGLGYYARARNLHKAAKQVVQEWAAEMPAEQEALLALPGIGRSTAAAILSLTDGVCLPILDGNVKRVFARHAAIAEWTGALKTQKQLWALAEARMPADDARAYNQGLMDLGSQVCRRSKPLCEQCPVAGDCKARELGLTAQLPSPKPKKVLPQKSAAFLLLLNSDQELLLQRRPSAGIWGGLWCLPQYDDKAELKNALRHQYQNLAEPQPLAPLQHVFSHYKLSLEPYQLSLGRNSKMLTIAEQNERWVPFAALADYGLPAPILKLLNREFAALDLA